MVDFHTGYELDMNDYRDISALCERFGIEFPSEYSKFRQLERQENHSDLPVPQG